MANSKVYLGYDEVEIPKNNIPYIDYKVNKIGGKPNWPLPQNAIRNPKCAMCGFDQLLVVQCYAPLDKSPFHRTLYVFACINVNCWEQSKGWTCIRSQVLDESFKENKSPKEKVQSANNAWCSGADEWEEFDMENANAFNAWAVNNTENRVADEDVESYSSDIEVAEQFGNLMMTDSKNANNIDEGGDHDVGAVGVSGRNCSNTTLAAAELEGGDEDLVTVEDMPMANSELNVLLQQTAALPPDVLESLSSGHLIFESRYMSVEQEWTSRTGSTTADDRVSQLLHKYNKENGDELTAEKIYSTSGGLSKGSEEIEQYEDVAPLHGDRLFHSFITRLQQNPEQVLRYSHCGLPLLGTGLPRKPAPCEKCGAERTYELQLMPSLSAALMLTNSDPTPGGHFAVRSLGHLYFMSVFVFTCVENCWTTIDSTVNEDIIVQPQTF